MSAVMHTACRRYKSTLVSVTAEMASKGTGGAADLSRRALKRKRAMGHYKKKQFKSHEPDAETSYYFENGLRKVYPYVFHFTAYVKERWIGRTLLDTFSAEFIQNSRDEVRREIENGTITVNGEVVSPDFKLKNNQLIAHRCHRHECPVLDTPIHILVDTADVLVIDKPASIPCHPCGRYRYNSILFILEKELGYTNLRTLHRLDRLTSGLLIYPKTTSMSKKLESQLARQILTKEYVCRVLGEFPEGEITVDQPIGLMARKVSLYGVVPDGKPSVTKFIRLSYNGKSSVVKCTPITGRTHQIRVHLQYLGHPIVNDPLYNSTAFGADKGKGGVKDKPMDDIERIIMQTSNVGNWVVGPNPDYVEKFGEDGLKSAADDVLPLDVLPLAEPLESVKHDISDNNVPKTLNSTGSSEPCANDFDSNVKPDQCNSDTNAGSKKQKLKNDASCDMEITGVDGSDKTEHEKVINNEKLMDAKNKTVAETGESAGSGDVDKGCNDIYNVPNDAIEVTSDPKCSDTESVVTVKSNVGDNGEPDAVNSKTCSDNGEPDAVNSKTCSDNGDNNENGKGEPNEPSTASDSSTAVIETDGCTGPHKVSNRRVLDRTKMTVSRNCKSCKNQYAEPLPRDLIIYLHAVSYKGPDWEYSTQLPYWAHADFTEEDIREDDPTMWKQPDGHLLTDLPGVQD